LHAKADAASASLEQVIEDAVGALKQASTPAPRKRLTKRRSHEASASTQPVGDSANWQALLGLHRDTHY
jgi:hypothetical protein